MSPDEVSGDPVPDPGPAPLRAKRDVSSNEAWHGSGNFPWEEAFLHAATGHGANGEAQLLVPKPRLRSTRARKLLSEKRRPKEPRSAPGTRPSLRVSSPRTSVMFPGPPTHMAHRMRFNAWERWGSEKGCARNREVWLQAGLESSPWSEDFPNLLSVPEPSQVASVLALSGRASRLPPRPHPSADT